jgi:hypothetical protein
MTKWPLTAGQMAEMFEKREFSKIIGMGGAIPIILVNYYCGLVYGDRHSCHTASGTTDSSLIEAEHVTNDALKSAPNTESPNHLVPTAA